LGPEEFDTNDIMTILGKHAQSLEGMYGGVTKAGSPGGTDLHGVLSSELPKDVADSPLLITEAIIDKQGYIKGHGKGPGAVNALPGGNVQGTYETIDVLVIDDELASTEEIRAIREGKLSARGRTIPVDLKLGGARMSEAKAQSLKGRLGGRPLLVGQDEFRFYRSGNKLPRDSGGGGGGGGKTYISSETAAADVAEAGGFWEGFIRGAGRVARGAKIVGDVAAAIPVARRAFLAGYYLREGQGWDALKQVPLLAEDLTPPNPFNFPFWATDIIKDAVRNTQVR
jgi:hypothetical protein